MTTNSAVFAEEKTLSFSLAYSKHINHVFSFKMLIQPIVFLAVQWRNCLPVGERVLLPSLLLSLYTADPAFELNRDCVRTNDERASERSVGLWRGRKKNIASPPPPRKRRASSRSCSARARVKVPIRPSVRVRCFSTASSIATVNDVCTPGWEGGIYRPKLGKQSWCE